MKALREKLAAVFMVALWSLIPSPAHPEEKLLEDIIASIQQRYSTINTIEADFIQKNFIASLNQFREFQGKIFLKRPHFFAMEVTVPGCQRLIFDGQFFWIYTATNNQALKSSVAPGFLEHPLISLLTTMADLKKTFFITRAATSTAHEYSLKLTLKHPDTEIQGVDLTVRKQDGQVKELVLYYGSGNYTQLSLLKTKENPDIPPGRFQFIPPPGVEIEENPTPLTRP